MKSKKMAVAAPGDDIPGGGAVVERGEPEKGQEGPTVVTVLRLFPNPRIVAIGIGDMVQRMRVPAHIPMREGVVCLAVKVAEPDVWRWAGRAKGGGR